MDEAETLGIRSPACDEDIALLERYLPRSMPERHRERYLRQQAGHATYFVAWLGGRPVGHVLLHWDRPQTEPMLSMLQDCPELEDFYVDPPYRGRGIGMLLLKAAEALAIARGYARIGLAVGLTPDYDRARALYMRRGYRNAGFGLFYAGWWYRDETGQSRWWEEACEYLVKPLKHFGMRLD